MLAAVGLSVMYVSITLSSCTYERVVWSQYDQLRNLPNQATGASQSAILDDHPRGGNPFLENLDKPSWAIRLKIFEDGDELEQRREATKYARDVKAATNTPNLWVGTWDNRTAVYRGRYLDVEGADATNDMRQTRMLKFEGKRPFRKADFERVDHLIKPTEAAAGAVDDMDMRQHFGKDRWALQVAIYDADHTEDPQQAAEAYVVELREAGEKAYYYHDSSGRSMVLIGAFTYAEAWTTPRIGPEQTAQQDVYSPAIRELQERFPYNLLNDDRITDVNTDGESMGYQPSVLVKLK